MSGSILSTSQILTHLIPELCEFVVISVPFLLDGEAEAVIKWQSLDWDLGTSESPRSSPPCLSTGQMLVLCALGVQFSD